MNYVVACMYKHRILTMTYEGQPICHLHEQIPNISFFPYELMHVEVFFLHSTRGNNTRESRDKIRQYNSERDVALAHLMQTGSNVVNTLEIGLLGQINVCLCIVLRKLPL